MPIKLAICSREETQNYKEEEFTHLLSIVDPERGYDGIIAPKRARVMRLIGCHDLDDIECRAEEYSTLIAPQKKHVKEIIEVFGSLRSGDGILIHCESGISRSTAAAVVGLVSRGIPPEEAFTTVTKVAELALPNRRILRLAGELLKDQGKLKRLGEAHRKELFARHDQSDPVEALAEKLSSQPWEGIKRHAKTLAGFAGLGMAGLVSLEENP